MRRGDLFEARSQVNDVEVCLRISQVRHIRELQHTRGAICVNRHIHLHAQEGRDASLMKTGNSVIEDAKSDTSRVLQRHL